MNTKISPLAFILTLVITAGYPIRLKADIHEPLIMIPLVATAPVIDGKLSEQEWKQCTRVSEFINWTRDSYIKDPPLTVYLCHDKQNIYVAFRNSDPEAADLKHKIGAKAPRDSFLWGRNHDMLNIGSKDVSLQLMGDPAGTISDWKNSDINWNGNWIYSSSVDNSGWTAEFSVPIKELGISSLSPDEVFSISFSRSYPQGESSNWSGKAVMSSKTFPEVNFGKWPEPFPGKNKIEVTVHNSSGATENVRCELELTPFEGKPDFINQTGQGTSSDFQLKVTSPAVNYQASLSVNAAETTTKNLEYDLAAEKSYLASLTFKAGDGRIIRRSIDYWFSIEPNTRKLKDLRERIGESIAATSRLSDPVSAGIRQEAEQILASIERLQSDVDSFRRSGRWNELTVSIAKLETEVSQHLHKVRWTALHQWRGTDDFGIGFAHSIIKLRRDALFPVPLSDKVELSLAGNEYESFQLALLPFGKDLKNVTVDISALSDKSGNIIDKSNIEMSLVGYNLITWQADYVAEKGWHPDPLMPLKNGFNIEGSDLCRPLWITVYAPAGTKAGDYSGKITIRADGMKEVTANVVCRVWGFDLPKESHLKTHTWDELEYLKDFYNKDEYPLDWYLNFCNLLLKNRMNPGFAGVNYLSTKPDKNGNWDFSRVEKVLTYCMDRGLTRFSILQMKKGEYKPEDTKAIYDFVAAYAKFLRKKGWIDKALVELWDEPTDVEWPGIKERAEKLKKIDPGLRLQLFAEGGPYDFWDKATDKYGLNGLVDIWAPVNIVESPETQAKGGEIWTYFCTLARECAPNFFIDCPAIYQRSIAWYCWMYGVDGFEHWSTTYFWRNVHKGKPMDQKWPSVPWDSRSIYYMNGDGQLVYPGPEGIPLPSIRLENFRDGMEDYEYLFRLRELLEKYKDNTTDATLNEYRQLLNPETYLLYKYPRKIKVTLEHTLRYPDQPERVLETRQQIAMAIEDLQSRK